jgi:hypothetical protein
MLWKQLSPTQTKVCELLIQGVHPSQMHTALGINKRTVKSYVQRCYAKAGLNDLSKNRYVQLAVMLTYELHPGLRPTGGITWQPPQAPIPNPPPPPQP